MKLRVKALLAANCMSAYDLVRALDGIVNERTVYRLAADDWQCLKREHLDALCDVFGVEPGELLERDTPKRKR